jgi:hypothetical protein
MLPVVMVVSAGVSSIDATGTRATVTCVVAVTPSLTAAIETCPPTSTPVTRPVDETVAVAGADDVH